MTAIDWDDPNARSLAIYLDGSGDPDRAADGSPLVDDDFLVLVNGWWETARLHGSHDTCAPGVVRRDRHLRPVRDGDLDKARRR